MNLVELNLAITEAVKPLLPPKVAYIMVLMDVESRKFTHATNIMDTEQHTALLRDVLRQWAGE